MFLYTVNENKISSKVEKYLFEVINKTGIYIIRSKNRTQLTKKKKGKHIENVNSMWHVNGMSMLRIEMYEIALTYINIK